MEHICDSELKLRFQLFPLTSETQIECERRHRKQRKHLQVRHIGLAQQISDSTGLSENLTAVKRAEATTARLVEESEVLIRCAAEDRERGQR